MNVVILCGGKGTRLKTISKGQPKVLIPINKRPFIYFLLDTLINNGFKKIFLLTAYKSKFIKDEVGDFYKEVPLIYIEDNKELKSGTAAAIYSSYHKLPDHFLLQYGDTILDIDYKKFYKKSKELKDSILMSIYKNEEGLDKNNVLYKDNKLIYYNSESNSNNNITYKNYIDYGLLGVHKLFLKKHICFLKENESLKNFQEKMSNLDLIRPFLVNKRFYEIGNPESFNNFKNAYLNGDLNYLFNHQRDF